LIQIHVPTGATYRERPSCTQISTVPSFIYETDMQRLLLLSLLLTTSASAQTTEEIFEQAREYTVQIRTAVTMPFLGDKKTSSLGAGFVVDAKRGWVMTNAHVVARSPSHVRVARNGQPFHDATKVYVDPYLDVALIKVAEPMLSDLNTANLECSEIPAIGVEVGAFGHPWGLSYTGTRGIISGITSKLGGEMLQTDAAINGGNSGGPLISLKNGRIVGINTARVKDKGDQNTNFAVPMKYACRILTLLQNEQNPSPPELSTVFVKSLDDQAQLVVAKTYPRAGTIPVKNGDVILKVAEVPGEIRNEGQLVHALRGRLDKVVLEIIRGEKQMTISGSLPPRMRITDRQGVYVSGLLIGTVGFRDNNELNMGNDVLMVHHVSSGSLGSSLEIKKWDFLVTVNGENVNSLETVYQRLEAAQLEEKSVTLMLKRWSNKQDRIYDYIERSVSVNELKSIGALATEHLALKSTL